MAFGYAPKPDLSHPDLLPGCGSPQYAGRYDAWNNKGSGGGTGRLLQKVSSSHLGFMFLLAYAR
jgi:hypothetical protein